MSDIKNGGPAFPGKRVIEPKLCAAGTALESGMTILDYFAAKAMQAIVSGHLGSGEHMREGDTKFIADKAYFIAEAMLRAREAS